MKSIKFSRTSSGWFYKNTATGILLCCKAINELFPGIKRGRVAFEFSKKAFKGSMRVTLDHATSKATIKGEVYYLSDDCDKLLKLVGGRVFYVKMK